MKTKKTAANPAAKSKIPPKEAPTHNSPNRAKARALLNGRSLVFASTAAQEWQFDVERFKRFVDFAAEFGATHLKVNLPFQYGSWVLPDNTDPYAAWTIGSVGVLRLCPPPELQPWVPLEQAQASRDIILTQLDIMKPYGLKAIAHAVEPMWLPEGVYREHPRWRGAQCELGRIASSPYFAPSIDEPEVLDLYRRAMREFATLFPQIDQLSFLSNDSGAGLGWAPCLYPGMNGASAWRTRDGGARIAGWLAALRAGAADANGKIRINISSSGLPAEWVASSRAKLEPDTFVNSKDSQGDSLERAGAGLGSGLWSVSYPAVGLGNPQGMIEGLQSVFHNPQPRADRASVYVAEDDLHTARAVFEAYFANPGQGSVRRAQLAFDVAQRLAGTAAAETLVRVWGQVASAQHGISQVRQKGFSLILPFCLITARWLVRPLVPRPQSLTPQETAHYRDIMFASEKDRDNPSFGLILGKGVFRGESVTWMSRWGLVEANQGLNAARNSILDLIKEAASEEARTFLRLYATRIGVLGCLTETARNTIMYQYALDTAGQPQYGPNMMDYDDNIIYDMRALSLRKIAREELDNIAELVELIESVPDKVLEHADSKSQENVFMLGPDPIGDLKRKMTIMMDHWQEYEQLYPTTKVWDFEAPSVGNIVNGPTETK